MKSSPKLTFLINEKSNVNFKNSFENKLFGGGSDLEHYFREFGGAVLSTAIDKFVFVAMNDKFDDAVRVAYSINEEVLDRFATPYCEKRFAQIRNWQWIGDCYHC